MLRPHLSRTAGGATFYHATWCEIEGRPGFRDWSQLDGLVNRAQDLGYEVVMRIQVGSCWATGHASIGSTARRRTASVMPLDMRAYHDFVQAVVQRYSSRGITEYAIENEVNATNFWLGTTKEYEQLARVAAQAIRGADPGAMVLDSGISSVGYGIAIVLELLAADRLDEALDFYHRYYQRRWEDRKTLFPPAGSAFDLFRVLSSDPANRAASYLAATFRLANEGLFDAYQLHFYEPWDTLPKVLDFIARHQRVPLPIEAWEVGVAWPGQSYDEEQHAAETVKMLVTLLQAGVRRAIYLPAAYTPGGLSPREIWRGLLLPTGEPRPAFAAYAGLVAALSDSHRWRGLTRRDVSGIAFERAGGATLVMWSRSPNGSILQGPPPADAVAQNVLGQCVHWGQSGLLVGSDPILITGPAVLATKLEDRLFNTSEQG